MFRRKQLLLCVRLQVLYGIFHVSAFHGIGNHQINVACDPVHWPNQRASGIVVLPALPDSLGIIFAFHGVSSRILARKHRHTINHPCKVKRCVRRRLHDNLRRAVGKCPLCARENAHCICIVIRCLYLYTWNRSDRRNQDSHCQQHCTCRFIV